jgi:hypothetical protein
VRRLLGAGIRRRGKSMSNSGTESGATDTEHVSYTDFAVIMFVGAMPPVFYLLWGFEIGVMMGLGQLAAVITGLDLA